MPMDPNQAAAFMESAAAITEGALNGLSATERADIDSRLESGGELYLHVQMIPECIVVLALDPAPGDPAQATVEIARYTDPTSEEVERLLN